MTVATRKIFKTGNSLVIALPRDILDLLHLREGAEVSVDIDQGQKQIVIAPTETAAAEIDTEFARQVSDFIDAYRPALEALAQ